VELFSDSFYGSYQRFGKYVQGVNFKSPQENFNLILYVMPCVLLEELAADSLENKLKNSNDSCARCAAASSLVAVVLDVFLALILPTFATLLTINCPRI
jgi:hypothetical protein